MSFLFIEVENKEGGLTKNKAGGLLTYKNVKMTHAPKVYKLKDRQTWRQMSTLAEQKEHMGTNKQHKLGKIPKQIAFHKLMH
jgi:hypothetical protein